MNNIYRSIWNAASGTQVAVAETSKAKSRRGGSAVLAASAVAAALACGSGTAQAALVSACTGVSLPKSVVTDIVGAAVLPVTGILDSVLGLPLGSLGLSSNLTASLTSIAAGDPLTLNVLDVNGNVVNQGADCVTTADSFQLDGTKGISIGGNKITGLGNGAPASAGEINSIAFGNGATTAPLALNSIAIGPNASVGAAGINSVAIGSAASATAPNSVALGADSIADRANTVSVGSAGNERQITNVAAGTADTDAVNVSQLQAVDDSAVKYDDPNLKTTVTLGGPLSTNGGATGGTTITNVHQGALSPTSTDAVNGSQLYATNLRIDNMMDGGGIKYFHANSTKADSQANGADSVAVGGAAVAGGDGSVAIGDNSQATQNGAIAIGQNSTASGVNSIAIGNGAVATGSVAVGAGAQAGNGGAAFGDNAVALTAQQGTALGNGATVTADRGVALGAGSQATRAGMNGATEKYSNVAVTSNEGAVSVGSAGNERQITNVAGGTAPTDAVNVRQLDAAVAQANQNNTYQIDGLRNDISNVQRDANAGTAGAMAMASMPQAAFPGKNMVATGMATYQGQSALSIGVSTLSDNGRWVFKLNGTANTRGNAGVGVGAGMHF